MKKFLFLMLALVLPIVFTSCGDDDDPKGGLKGWYVYDLPAKGSSDYTGQGYYFENSNTVTYWNTISGSPRWDGIFSSTELPGLSGYYGQSGCGQTYTYTVDGNKIYIPMQGRILTIDGVSLRLDGSGVTYRRP